MLRLAVAALVASPVLAFLLRGATSKPGPLPAHAGVLSATLESLLLGACAAAGATLLAWPAALVLRAARQGAPFLVAAVLVPLVMPSYVLAIGWYPILGTHGLLAFLSDPAPLYTPLGAGVVQAFQLWPVPALLGAAALRRADARCEESARVMAGRSVTWMLALPGLGAGFAVALAIAVGDFGVSGCFNVNTIPEMVYSRMSTFNDPRAAAAMALPLVVTLPLALLLAGRAAGGLLERRSTPGRGAPPIARLAFAALLALAVGVPLGQLVRSGASSVARVASLHHSEILASLAYAGSATVLAGLAAVLSTGYRLRRFVEVGFVLPFALPGVITALGMRAIDRQFELGTSAEVLLALALSARVAWLPWKALDLSLGARLDAAMEAAAVHGAGPIVRWRGIFVPRALPALVAGLAGAFLLALGDAGVAAILYPPSGPTVSWRIFALIHYGYQSNVAALCLLLCGGVLAVGACAAVVAVKRGTRSGER